MKTLQLFGILGFCLIFTAEALASPVTINDTYIGGGATHASYDNQDVIGNLENFDISSMEVNLQGSLLTVSIFSTYFTNVGLYETVLGDLFISTDGYNPFGAAPHADDTALNGEDWELALVLDEHGGEIGNADGVQNFLGQNGTIGLYTVQQENILLTDVPNGIFRGDQETQYDTSNQTALAFGTWSIHDVAGSDYDALVFTIDLGAFAPTAGSILGFHWNMTCGNDTIEGSYATPSGDVPEPGSLLLLLSGIVGLRRKQSRR